MTTFLENILQVSKDTELVKEVENIDFKELKKETEPKNEDYVFGSEYRKGAFITDPNYNVIYKKQFPLLFEFLMQWHNLR